MVLEKNCMVTKADTSGGGESRPLAWEKDQAAPPR